MFATIEQIIRQNQMLGHHWFDKGTKRFFSSRVLPKVYAGRYFITSEVAPYADNVKRYTIREAHKDGKISTLGDFQAYKTRPQAIAALKRHIANNRYAPLMWIMKKLKAGDFVTCDGEGPEIFRAIYVDHNKQYCTLIRDSSELHGTEPISKLHKVKNVKTITITKWVKAWRRSLSRQKTGRQLSRP